MPTDPTTPTQAAEPPHCKHILVPGQAHCLKCDEKILYNPPPHRLKPRVALITLLVLAPIWNFPLHYVLVKLGAVDLQWFLFWVYMPLALEISGKVADRFALEHERTQRITAWLAGVTSKSDAPTASQSDQSQTGV